MINILYIITDMNIGGTEKMLFETVVRIDKNKYCPVVCSLKKAGVYSEKLVNRNIEFMSLDIYRFYGLFLPLFLLYGIFRIVSIIRKRNIDIVHTYLFQANIIGRISSKLSGKNLIVISSFRGKETDLQFLIERYTSKLADKFIANSYALKDLVIKKTRILSQKIDVIYNGIETANLIKINRNEKLSQLNLTNNDILIGTVGRLHKEKGINDLITSVEIVIKKYNNIKCLIVGDGPEKKFFESRIHKLGLENKIYLLGFRIDAVEIISILDIFILCSPYEGMPNVILEAMVYGIPVIVTSVGGVIELIKDNENGMTVEYGNPNALAEKILYCINNKTEIQKMALKSKEYVKKFSIDNMINNIQTLYRELYEKKYIGTKNQ